MPADRDRARDWLRDAARQGYVPAQRLLGELALVEEGQPAPEAGQALVWYSAAAATGDPQAQYVLALLLGVGAGAPDQEQQTTTWLNAAARQGHRDAQHALCQGGDLRWCR